jgi:hypothetical protein
MNRLELLGIVRANKEKHEADFIESVKDYEAAVLVIAADNVKISRDNQKQFTKKIDMDRLKQPKHYPPAPKSFATEYSRAARMLELGVEDVIEVEEDIFNQLVLDEWSWKHQFQASSVMYKTMNGSM